MSAYIEIPMPILDQECLIQALERMGFEKSKIEIHETPTQLQGYMGDLRNTTANIVIQKRFVGQASNDLGFRKTASGYRFIVSDYDKRRYNSTWQQRLMNHYAPLYESKLERIAEEERKRIEEEKRVAREERRNIIVENAKRRGYIVSEERQGNTIQLVLVRREY